MYEIEDGIFPFILPPIQIANNSPHVTPKSVSLSGSQRLCTFCCAGWYKIRVQQKITNVFVYAQCETYHTSRTILLQTISFFQICVKIFACPFVLQMPDLMIIPSIGKKQKRTKPNKFLISFFHNSSSLKASSQLITQIFYKVHESK